MGGGTTLIPLVNWRGAMVSQDMVAPLEELAASVSPYVKPIAGYGSYRDNAASGGTDNGSGHLDIYAATAGWNDEERAKFVARGRQLGFAVFDRKQKWWSKIRNRWLSETWAHHFHLILKDSADLSDGAKKQLSQWYRGSNGLAGLLINGVWHYDPDDGPRTHLRQTWSQYQLLKELEDMELTDPVPLSDAVAKLMNKPKGTKWSFGGLVQYAAGALFAIQNEVRPKLVAQTAAMAELKGVVAGQGEMLKQLLASGSVVDVEAVLAASREAARLGAAEGAAAAIDEIIDEADIVLKTSS